MASFNSDLLYNALNDSSITDLLDTQTINSVVITGLFDGRMIPSKFTKYKTINYYLSSPINGALEWNEYRYSVNCRAKTDGESRSIAQAVFTRLNREDFTGYHMNCSVVGTLPPADDTDVFNTPIEVLLKSRL